MGLNGSHKVVLCNGCFDPMHYGHVLHLQAAKKLGDRLVVSITKDRSVNKGPSRPVFFEDQRAEVIFALKCVDDVLLVDSSNEALRRIRPHIFVKGSEYINKLDPFDVQFCIDNDIRIAFTTTQKYSSTKLLSHESRHS